jgi:flagellar biosynthetic protein FliQ
MTPLDFLDVARDGLIVLLKIGAPVMSVALIVGLIISLFQALTQIQEMTLAFVPKILVIFLSLIVLLPFMMTTLTTFSERLFDRIVAIG